MKPAHVTDWQTKPLPTQRTTVALDRTFSAAEMERIRLGLIPEQMEDKWFIYWTDDALYFHRSWTGVCIYIVRFAADGEGGRMTDAMVNRDSEQYLETSDQRDVELNSYLIDLLLLHRDARAPISGAKDHEAAETWGLVGRAMLGEHPDRGSRDRS